MAHKCNRHVVFNKKRSLFILTCEVLQTLHITPAAVYKIESVTLPPTG